MINRRRAFQNILLVLASCVLSMVLGELLVRALLPPPEITHVVQDPGFAERLSGENQQQIELKMKGRPNAGGKTLYISTPTGQRLRANTVTLIENHRLGQRDIIIRTNSLGYRNPEVGEKKEGGKRVLFLGDSITFGDWLHEAETFVRRVEELSFSGRRRLETINAGVGAIGLANELAILMETGLRTAPDTVVLCFYLNDAQPSPGVRVLDTPRFFAGSHLMRHVYRAMSFFLLGPQEGDERRISEAERDLWRQEVRQNFPPGPGDPLVDPRAFNRSIRIKFIDWGGAWTTTAWRRMEPLFREIKRQSEINRFQLLIVGFPVRLQVEAEFVYDYPQRELRRIAADIDAPVLDLLPVLREHYHESSTELFYDHCHHTPYGNEVIAEAILKFIEENPLPG